MRLFAYLSALAFSLLLLISTQSFRVLKTLYRARGETVPYLNLVRCLKPNAQEANKSDKQKVRTVIKNLKKALGIKKGPNKDIFHNEKMVGYSLRNKD